MPLVFIPTDDTMIIPGITREYSRQGWDVVVGTQNFFLKLHRPDLLHLQWPEELANWQLPSPPQLKLIEETASWWAERCPMAVSVNNFYPHGYDHHPVMKELYEIFYRRSKAIIHYSKFSRERVPAEFPAAGGKNHLIADYFCYDRLLPAKLDRPKWRKHFGYEASDFVVLVFGALRSWNEVELLQEGFARAAVAHKRLLWTGRYSERLPRFQRFRRNMMLNIWFKRHRAMVNATHIADEEVHQYCEVADAIIVPRLTDMTSGLVGLGLTFGIPIVSPNQGAYPEYLKDTDNPFYEPGNSRSLAQAIQKAALVDREKIRMQNRIIAERWNWRSIISAALSCAPETASAAR